MLNSPNNLQLIERILDDQDCTYEDTDQIINDSKVSTDHDPNFVEMVIELDSQNTVTIQIGQYDDPITLAKRFCYEYNIDPRVINTLANNIRSAKCSLEQGNNHEKENNGGYAQNNHVHSQSYHNASTSSIGKKSQKSASKYNLRNSYDPRICSYEQDNVSIISQSGQSVFDRLYQDSKNKQLTKKITTMASQTAKKSVKDKHSLNTSQNCSLLYERNIKLKEETKKKSQRMLQNKVQQQQAECTHYPRINPLSRVIAEKLKQTQYGFLSSSQEKRSSKVMDYVMQRESKQMEECTFQPKILTKSRNKSISTTTQRFLLLHQDHNLRQTKRKMVIDRLYQQKYIFQPKVNAVSTAIVKGKKFFERLKQYQQQKSQNQLMRQTIRKSEQRRHPSTGRGPLNRNKGQMNIGQYLYERHRSRKQQKSHSRSKSKENQKFMLPKSLEIYDERKKIAFRYLFTLMDSDQDGLISSTKTNIAGMSDEVLRLISPILSQMEQIKAQLDQQEFVESFSRLFSTLSVHQKNSILQVYKHQNHGNNSEEPSFHPSINENSQILTRSRQPGMSLYELWKQNYMSKQAKLSNLRAEKQLLEYEQCTFQPNSFPLQE